MNATLSERIKTKNIARQLLILAIIAIFLVMIARVVAAQPENLDTRFVQMKEGKMFNIVFTPKSNKVDVLAVGNKIADIKYDKVGLTARVKVGKNVRTLSTKRTGNSFVINDLPASGPSELILQLQYEEDNEQFKLDLN